MLKAAKLWVSFILPVKNTKHFFMIIVLEEMLTSEEKALLYEAIGYSETAVDPTLPKTVRCFLALYLRV